jgi:alpha-tubulin suppressor-like RCC1 family protein
MPLSSLNLSNVTKVSGGYGHSLAITSSGELYSWGLNANGQLGDGTLVNKTSPTRIGTATDWIDVACGDYHSLALKSNGAVYAWGKNTLGQCGSSTGGNITTPSLVTMTGSVAQIAASSDYSLFLTYNSLVFGTGDNTYKTISGLTSNFLTTPTQIADFQGSTLIAAGPTCCAAARLGAIYVRGTYDFVTANGIYTPSSINTATGIVPNSNNSYYISLDIGNQFLLAIKQDGKLYGYTFKGYTHNLTQNSANPNTIIPTSYPSQAYTSIGAYGIRYSYQNITNNLPTFYPDSNELVTIDESQNWLRLACGREHALLTNINGEVYSFGNNSLGQLGRTATGNSINITKLESPANTTNWNVVGCGSFHSLLCLGS